MAEDALDRLIGLEDDILVEWTEPEMASFFAAFAKVRDCIPYTPYLYTYVYISSVYMYIVQVCICYAIYYSSSTTVVYIIPVFTHIYYMYSMATIYTIYTFLVRICIYYTIYIYTYIYNIVWRQHPPRGSVRADQA